MAAGPKQAIDIAFTASRDRNVAALTDAEKRKQEKAEARLIKKQESRDAKANYQQYVDIKADRSYERLNASIDPELSKGKTRDLRLENFDISFGGKQILSNASCSLVFGRRYGLIGLNGVGKSTLLRSIARRDIVCSNKDGGVPNYVRILHVEQEVEGTD